MTNDERARIITPQPRAHLRPDGVPTRNDQSLMSPVEIAITYAMDAVEDLGASPALTEAVTLLGKARDRVADHIEGHRHTGAPSTSATSPPQIAYVVIDTETSGLPLYTEEINGKKVTVSADDPRQPYLAQACMIALDADLQVIAQFDGYVKPEGWEMQPGATEANGLTTEFLLEHGKPVAEVLDRYETFIRAGATVIAHNSQFDCKIMRGALRRADRPDLFEETKQFCTMRQWAKRQGGKWPNFRTLCAMLDVQLKDAHTAVGDATALVECVRKMRALAFSFEGEVHRSAFHPNQQGETVSASEG